MFSGLQLVTPPVTTPISVADAKAHSRVLYSADDQLIAGYISSATIQCQQITKRAFMPQTWTYSLEHFPGRSNPTGYQLLSEPNRYYSFNHIEVPLPPLQSIVSFTYMDTQGNLYNMQQGYTTQVGNYTLDTQPEPGRLNLPFSGIWPTTILLPGSPIQITYICGYNSYSGTCDLASNGIATWDSGSQFDPSIINSWITIGGVSYTAAVFTSATQISVVPGSPSTPIQAGTGLSFTANSVPMTIRHAILFLTGHFYENREPVVTGRSQTAIEVPSTVDDLLAPYRIILGVAA